MDTELALKLQYEKEQVTRKHVATAGRQPLEKRSESSSNRVYVKKKER